MKHSWDLPIILSICALFAVLFMACTKEGTPANVTGAKEDFSVTMLFEKDGCNIYRFYDGGYFHYFTTCEGETFEEHGCGRNCTRKESIKTKRGK